MGTGGSARASAVFSGPRYHRIIVQGLLCGLNPPLFLKQFSLIEMRFMRHDPHPSQVCSRGSEFIGDMCNFCLTPVTPPGLICPFSNALSM